MSLLIVFGTRPEFLKVKPLIDELTVRKLPFFTVFTNQHKDIVPSDFKPTVTLPEPVGGTNRLITLLVNITHYLGELLAGNDENVTHVLVQGDTTTALAGALAAINSKKKLIHLEAGLRTFDTENPYPEEYNRVLIAQMADYHFCATDQNQANLNKERLKINAQTYVVGNTIIDTLVPLLPQCEYQDKVLVTLHRRENHDLIEKWFRSINRLAKIYDNYEFILPIHPNPNVRRHADLLTDVKVVDPLGHSEFLNLLTKTRMVISDSGGIQEECAFFKKKVIVCRKVTERPESVGTTSIMCPDPEKLVPIFAVNDYKTDMSKFKCPFGEGTSSRDIVEILELNGIFKNEAYS